MDNSIQTLKDAYEQCELERDGFEKALTEIKDKKMHFMKSSDQFIQELQHIAKKALTPDF
jgi:hypothetical protein